MRYRRSDLLLPAKPQSVFWLPVTCNLIAFPKRMVARMPIRLTAAPTSSPLLQTAVPFPENSLIKLKSEAVWLLMYCVSEREPEKKTAPPSYCVISLVNTGEKCLSEFLRRAKKKKNPQRPVMQTKVKRLRAVWRRSRLFCFAQTLLFPLGSAQTQQAALWCATHTKKKSLLVLNPPTAKQGVLVVTRGQY